jgi:hypothetical protein
MPYTLLAIPGASLNLDSLRSSWLLVEKTFPQWKGVFSSLVVAIIAINQIIGPILLQKLLIKVQEVGKKDLGSY